MPHRAQRVHPLTGRTITLSARTPRELEAMLHHVDTLRNELRIGMKSPEQVGQALRRLTHGPITLERAAIAYARREGLAPETSRRVLSSWLGGPARPIAQLEVDALDASRLQQWIDHLVGEGGAQSTIGTSWRTLRAVVRYAATRGWIAVMPWGDWRPRIRGAKSKRREAARSPEELAELLAAARELDDEQRRSTVRGLCDLEARIAAVALLGLRQGELAGLRWRDVDAGALTVTIARQWATRRPPKGRRVCTLRGLPELFQYFAGVRERLEQLELVRPGADGPVFPESLAGREPL